MILLMGCQEIQQQAIKHNVIDAPLNQHIIQTKGLSIETRFLPPQGFEREATPVTSYAYFLRQIKLKPHGSLVHLYDGREKHNKVADAVLMYDVGRQDLQQCADAVMRIRAEYLHSQRNFESIHFKFTNGFEASFARWKNGERIQVNGNKCSWVRNSSPDDSHASLRQFLDKVYCYAGSLSLSNELKPVTSLNDIQPGDVFIIGGSPGHAVTVMDVAINKAGDKSFLLSQSYMPAQDIHILKNLNHLDISPWFRVSDIKSILETPEYTFEATDLMRFRE